MSIKISLLIPVYNTAEYLAKCLDSVMMQTYSNLEIIAVNDGSTDNSPEILERYAAKYSNLQVIHKPNGGLQSARKIGIEHSTGDFIGFLDSDDRLASVDAIAFMVAAITSQTQIIVGRINIETEKSTNLFPSSIFNVISAEEYLTKYLLCGRVSWNLVAKLFDSTLIKSVANDPIKVSAGEDALYTLLLVNAAKKFVSMVNKPVYNYYIRSGSITQSNHSKYIYDNYNVAHYINNLLQDKVAAKYRIAFSLLCMSNSFRYGWLGRKHPLNAQIIKIYKKTSGVLSLFTLRKKVQIWILIHFADFMSTFVFKNRINE